MTKRSSSSVNCRISFLVDLIIHALSSCCLGKQITSQLYAKHDFTFLKLCKVISPAIVLITFQNVSGMFLYMMFNKCNCEKLK